MRQNRLSQCLSESHFNGHTFLFAWLGQAEAAVSSRLPFD